MRCPSGDCAPPRLASEKKTKGVAEIAASKDQRIQNLPGITKRAGTQVPIGPWLLLGVAVTEFRRGDGEFRARLSSTSLRHDSGRPVAIDGPLAKQSFEVVDI